MTEGQPDNFVTVVSVGSKREENEELEKNGIPGYVTVLTIGEGDKKKDVIEEVIVYRLPGERLGFGLKFEGGTKANEFVECLFIQSCAADSPASHVKSSWGKLTEGDEVLEIDSVPVKTMTRVDCVRSLKDSNVAIKLLVRHVFEGGEKVKKIEQPPAFDDKRTPPPPPPVPPRKIPRKMMKKENFQDKSMEKKLHSPRCDNSRRDRRFSDGSLGPPDAEVYIDLFLQESTQSLSESDDTGSTISTVIDRFSSFPNTTTSSFSGSLPSTPTAAQRRIDITNVNINEDDDTKILSINKEENNNIISENNPLCFQDAPLSYGNERTKIIIADEPEEEAIVVADENKSCLKKPAVPPRSKDLDALMEKNKCKKPENLPRLVDFVPKSNGLKDTNEHSMEIIKLFLEHERDESQNNVDVNDNFDNNDADLYTSKWNMSLQLTTIGEVEEESSGNDFNMFNRTNPTAPVVIVETADVNSNSGKSYQFENSNENQDIDGSMATPPSDSRQPPDGDEFPDFIESNDMKDSYFKHIEQQQQNSEESIEKFAEMNFDDPVPEMNLLHSRSQSLIDMSAMSKEKTSRWNQIVEQRKRGLSKLKGLVIPESTENDVTPVNIPEIKSISAVTLFSVPKIETSIPKVVFSSQESISSRSSTVLPPVVSSTSNLPKYSPAFKRRSLQVYPTNTDSNNSEKTSIPRPNKLTDDDVNPPKSLESISSPTKSDCSFDYTKKLNKDSKLNQGAKPEYESDNDSAVSSSQSSYNSRFSPPASPTRSYDFNSFNTSKYDENKNVQNRTLKVSSVEAINRKNILASAKCRSGKDVKVGSPVIHRKEENKESEIDDVQLSKDNEGSSKNVENNSQVCDKTTVVRRSNEKLDYTEIRKELRTVNKTLENASNGSSSLLRSVSVPVSLQLTKDMDDSNQARKYNFGRKPTPISVKKLTQNFENLASSPTCSIPKKLPGKVGSAKVDIFENPNKINTSHPILTTKVAQSELKFSSTDLKPSKLRTKQETAECAKVTTNGGSSETIVLCLKNIGTSLGITLAGGVDEDKEITIHRIRYGSVAYHDGRLKRGDKVISINGKNTKGLTHADAGELLKEAVTEFTMVIQGGMEPLSSSTSDLTNRKSFVSALPSPTKTKEVSEEVTNVSSKEENLLISIVKDESGMGFSLEGGKESLQGDMPLLVKKIFTGGAAEKQGELKVGDQILKMNDIDFQNLTRIEAWNMMKKISPGPVEIHIYRKY